jgi:hypothetical protein
VYLYPTGDFEGLVSNVQFTLKWDDPTVALGELFQENLLRKSIPLQSAGEVLFQDGWAYQTFTGFGIRPLAEQGLRWEAGKEILLARLHPDNFHARFVLTRDAWTQAHNGNYYVELDGVGRTGLVQDSVAGGQVVAFDLWGTHGLRIHSIYPNPVRQLARVGIEAMEEEALWLELYDLNGRLLTGSSEKLQPGMNTLDIDMQARAAGVYVLRFRQGQEIIGNMRIVKN